MAEEKKFLDETMEQPKNRKLVAKNVVLAFVVFVILLLCVLAWFSSRNEATASGLSVKTSGSSGLEVSLDGGKRWGTSWSSKDTGEEGLLVSSALAKYDSTDSKNGGSLMQLLSGNGRYLYYPKNVDANGEAKNFEKISDDKAGDYCLEFEAYFRSENQCSVALTNQSKVEPCDTDTTNSYGISPDYIAGAARVAFLEEGGTESAPTLTKTGLWIPNPLYELTTTARENISYIKMPDNYGGSADIVGGSSTDTSGTSKYYLWTISNDATLTADNEVDYNRQALGKMRKIPLIKIDGTNKYYCQFYTIVPKNNRTEQVFLINSVDDSGEPQNWQETASSKENLKTYLKGLTNDSDLTVDWRANTDDTFSVTVDRNGDYGGFTYAKYDFYQFYCTMNPITSAAEQLVRIEFDSDTGIATLCNPDKTSVSINNPQGTGELALHEKIVVTQEPTIGMRSDLTGVDPQITGKDNSPCDLEVMSIATDDDDNNSYVFKNTAGKFLSISDGQLVTVENQEDAVYFYVLFGSQSEGEGESKITDKLLGYIDKSGTTPVIKYVTYNSSTNEFVLSESCGTDRYMIYQQKKEDFTNYGIRTDKTKPIGVQESNYYYFDGETKTKAVLDPKEYMISLDDKKNKDLVKLETTKEINGKTYYVGKMKVRIFAEGFDREAKKPMEKGKIKVSLQFSASNIS